ncbi:MAG: serine hydrolase, partial [Ruminococcus sp.]|nr:serine hydrolase [Candidatus Copronaster equi]
HHLLSMQAGKDISVFSDKSKNQWIKDFVDATWIFTPGDGGWKYVSENQYILCVMLTRVTGMSVTEYLTPRLYEPLGIDVPYWEHDIDGIEAGGWGLFIKTEDLAKFITCYQHNGMFNGKQVIPEKWVKLARGNYGDNSIVNTEPDSQCGYGYCFWHCGGANAYRADGMFSQFGIILKDTDASLIITSGEINETKTRNCIWRHFPKCLIKPRKTAPRFVPMLDALDDFLPEKPHSELESEISGRKISFRKNIVLNVAGFPTSMLPFPVTYMSADRAGNIDNVMFTFSDNECSMNWTEGDEENTILCGMDGKPRQSKIRLAGIDFTAISTAAWVEDNILEIHMRPIEAVCMRGIKLKFDGKNVSLSPFSKQSMRTMADALAADLDNLLPPVLQPLEKAAGVAFDMLPDIVDSTLFGKFTD